MLPEFMKRRARSWAGLSVCIERMTHTSSMQRPISGNSSLTSMPERPCLWKAKGEPMSLRPLRTRSPTFGGSWPWRWVRAGLGSKVSTCDGPPFMKRKMTRLALGVKCLGFGASGLLEVAAVR